MRVGDQKKKAEELYKGKVASLTFFQKNDKKHVKAVDADGKLLGHALQVGSRVHKNYMKWFPEDFPDPVENPKKKAEERYKGKVASLTFFQKNDKELVKAVDADGKPLGRALQVGSRVHKKYMKWFPKDFPDPDEYKERKKRTNELINLPPDEYKKRERLATDIVKFVRHNVGRYKVHQLKQNYKNFNRSYEIDYVGSKDDVYRYFETVQHIIATKLLLFMNSAHPKTYIYGSCKFNFNLFIQVQKKVLDNGKVVIERKLGKFTSPMITIRDQGGIKAGIQQAISHITNIIEEWLVSGSQWVISKIDHGYLNIVKYTLTKGSSYFKMDPFILGKKAVVNPQNTDNRCFFFCLILALHYDKMDHKKMDRLSQYKKFFDLYPDFDDEDMPVSIFSGDYDEKITKYENIIKHNITIVKYVLGSKEVLPFYRSTNSHSKTINLMLCIDEEKDRAHFVWVKNMSRLIGAERSGDDHHKFFCMKCLAHFGRQDLLDKHWQLCQHNEPCKIEMPPKDNCELKFTHDHAMLEVPFVVYADFEALVVPSGKEREEGKKTYHTSTHEACGAMYIIVSKHEKKVIKTFFKRGEGCVREFLKSLIKDTNDLYHEYFKEKKEMDLSPEEKKIYSESTVCHLCKGEQFATYEEKNAYWAEHGKVHPKARVRDHCHFFGHFRGLAHNSCNLRYQKRRMFPVIFHNLKGYDSHFLIRELKVGEDFVDDINVLALNTEKFLSFTLKMKEQKDDSKIGKEKVHSWDIRFLDSLAFLDSSVEKLAENLEPSDFKYLREFVESDYKGEDTERLFNLIKQKGFYPYEYMTSSEKFDDKKLPDKRHFISSLSHQTKSWSVLSNEQQEQLTKDHMHARLVFNKFKCKNLGDYHDLYLRTDVYLLADIFEKFRATALEKFSLDPCHYFTLPSLGWDAMLKMTDVSLKLFDESETDMYLFCEAAKIGGISGTGGLRYARANNKYLPNFIPDQKSEFVMYGDANGLYSWAMSQKLPIDTFSWEDPETFDLDKALEDCDGDFGCFLEVDAELSEELHDKQNDYPCFPENMVITSEMESPYMKKAKRIIRLMDNPKATGNGRSGVKKLVPNLMPKTHNIVHIKTLKLYRELGWKVTKVHRVLRFRQSAWMKPYIDLCMTERKKKGISEFEKNFWKLCCNAVYGKTLENVRNYSNVKMTTNPKKLQKWVNWENYKGHREINDQGLVLVDMAKQKLKLCKPIYAGIAVLNLSKYHMYDFWYNTIKKKYPTATMCYTDTDSFIFHVYTNDIYEDMRNDPDFLNEWDISNYPDTHALFKGLKPAAITELKGKNAKVVGMFKDEAGGIAIVEYIGLRAKMYSLLLSAEIDGRLQKNTGNGIKTAVLKNIDHQHYQKCMFHKFDGALMRQIAPMNYIRTDGKHNLIGVEITKTTLSSYDDKKFVCDDGITQWSYGHHRIAKYKSSINIDE